MYFTNYTSRHDLTLTTTPLGCSPNIRTVKNTDEDLSNYPSQGNLALQTALAEETGLAPTNICLGAGIDGLLFSIFGSGLSPGSAVAAPEVTFPKVASIVSRFGSTLRSAAMKPTLEIDFDGMKCLAKTANLVYLANPSNPTGIVENRSEIRRLCEATDGSVVVDEANGEFDDSQSSLAMVPDLPNLIVLRTFSKAYGLASLRIGYCAAQEQTIAQLVARAPRFAASGPSARMALIGLADKAHIQRTVAHVRKQTRALITALRSRGVWCSASTANCFVMHLPARVGHGVDFLTFCATNGISLVSGGEFGLSGNHFRIAPQLDEANNALIDALDAFMRNKHGVIQRSFG